MRSDGEAREHAAGLPGSDLSRWQTGLTVLSLDRGLPFWPTMRLDVRNPAPAREAAQAAVEGLWRSDRSHASVVKEVGSFLQEVERACGEADRQAISDWVDGAFALSYQSDEGAQAALWWPLLNAVSGLRPNRPVAPLGLDPAKKTAIVDELIATLSGAVSSSDVSRQAPSKWDRRVEKEYGAGSPIDWIGSVSRFVATQAALNKIVEILEPAEMSAFMAWAAQQAPLHGMEADLLQEPRSVALNVRPKRS